ncbi:MAG: ABC transporter ATP-binding protein [Myxococcales bacterium]|nr:ABC transporter ATP-binding protein [Myxococcales bacterium]
MPQATSRPAAYAARLHGVSKAFVPRRPVLDGVDLAVRAGEIHALLGENGAGKSTLMKILVGLLRPDAGSISLADAPVDLDRFTPAEAVRRGIGMVHQVSALVPAMTVVENLAFGDARAGLWFHPRRARRAAERLAARFQLEVSLDRRVEDLAMGERQRAEILRALGRGARLLILDEPTSVLTPREAEALFASLRGLRDAGRAVIFISHKLSEVEAVADRVTILRQGKATASLSAREADARELGRLMLGRDVPPLERPARTPSVAAPALEIRGLCAPGLSEASRLREIDLRLDPGEILGIVGIDGNGQRELEEVLAGVRRPTRGDVCVGGRRIAPRPRALRAAGLAHLSGDRDGAGLISAFTLAENWILKGSHDDRRFFRRGWLDRAAARRAARAAAERFGIVPADPDAPIASLSGGNAQKLAVARELDGDPSVLVAVNPTRGLDVGSARFVHDELLARRRSGGAVLLISTDLDEVLALSDRITALVRGALAAVPPGSDRAAIGAILLGEAAA